MRQSTTWMFLVLTLLAMTGCSHRTPTIAHAHVGHAMTGWYDTPNQEGLFVVAENRAFEAMRSVQTALAEKNDLERIKADIARTGEISDTSGESKMEYGLKQALALAVDHISYAAAAPDASANIKAFADGFAANAAVIIERCNLIKALSGEVEDSESVEEAELLAPEIAKFTRANIHGEDLNADGVVGSSPNEYGVLQLRRDIEQMLDREDPPYSTVDSWYLFNLIRLPDGRWIFRERKSGSSSYPSSGSGGGGGY